MNVYFNPVFLLALLAAVPVYWALPSDRRRLQFVCLLSAGLLAYLHPVFVVVVVAAAVLVTVAVRSYRAGRWSAARFLLFGIALAFVILALGKYGGELYRSLWSEGDWFAQHLLAPLGVSYFAFRLVQYAIDSVRGVITDRSFLRFLAFLLFLPTFPAGPIDTYQGLYERRRTTFHWDMVAVGARRIAVGYFKKIVLADWLLRYFFGPVFTPGFGLDVDAAGVDPLAPWLFVILMFVRAYLDLSAYTDLAIGFSSLFGFKVMENFDRPFWKQNLGEFWRSWHISLSSWCTRNVYYPVFGATRNTWLALYATMLIMGLWHHVDLNWLCWGLWHGTGLVAFSVWSRRRRKWKRLNALLKKPGLSKLGHVGTFLFVALGYAFVATPSIGAAATVLEGCLRGPFLWLSGA